jgi:uncharacterized C2H2 Zn-finger protein
MNLTSDKENKNESPKRKSIEQKGDQSETDSGLLDFSLNGLDCTVCNKNFARRSSLQKHVELLHQNKMLKCTQCTKVSTNLQFLKRHVQVQHGHKNSEKFIASVYGCVKCTRHFNTWMLLKKHAKSKHKWDISSAKLKACTINLTKV